MHGLAKISSIIIHLFITLLYFVAEKEGQSDEEKGCQSRK